MIRLLVSAAQNDTTFVTYGDVAAYTYRLLPPPRRRAAAAAAASGLRVTRAEGCLVQRPL